MVAYAMYTLDFILEKSAHHYTVLSMDYSSVQHTPSCYELWYIMLFAGHVGLKDICHVAYTQTLLVL